jgi:hypothetical protein
MRSRVDLPQPEGADKDDEFAMLDIKIDAFDDFDFAIALAERFEG